MGHHWTAESIDYTGADSLEVYGVEIVRRDPEGKRVRQSGEETLDVEPITSKGIPADFYSVYLHKTGQGAECIADRDHEADAWALAEAISHQTGLEIRDYRL